MTEQESFERLDSRLVHLARGLGAMRLRLGEGLLRLEAVDGIRALGFPTLESYAREALGRSGRWASDARSLARRLAELPRLREALASGRLATSMVELVAKVATPLLEGSWIALAETMTVRQMRVHLKASDEDAAPAPRTTVQMTVDRIDAWAFESARHLVEAVGAARGEEAVEAMLAEGLGELLARHDDVDLPSTLTGPDDEERRWRAEMAELRASSEAVAEAAVPTEPAPVVALDVPGPDEADVADPAAIDAGLRVAVQELAVRDLELADLLSEASERETWRAFRYASFEHYVRDRLGLSVSGVAARIAFGRRLVELPEVGRALVAGRIGYEAASLVSRIAGPRTVSAWVDRAEARTVKQLREEIDAVTMLARADGLDARRLGPPDDETLADLHAVERAAIATVVAPSELQMSGGPADDVPPPLQMSGGAVDDAAPSGTMTALRLSLHEDIARFWRSLERLHADLEGGSFVAFLVRATLKAWAGSAPRVAYADIYLRDRWRCASPVCRSKNVTPHHVLFRSRGGDDGSGNVVSLCVRCHLELVHGQRLRVTGDADAGLSWRALGWSAGAAVLERSGDDGARAPAA